MLYHLSKLIVRHLIVHYNSFPFENKALFHFHSTKFLAKRDWYLMQQPTETSKQPIRACYLGHVSGYQPIRDQYFLVRSFAEFHTSLTAPT